MSKAKTVLFLTFLVGLSSVKSTLLLPDFDLPWNRIDDCKNSCDKTYEEKSADQASSCARGCRFYSMAEMIAKTTELDSTIAMKACTSSCQDKYPIDTLDRAACLSGCDTMSKLKKEAPEDVAITSSFSFSFFFDDGNGLKSLQSDGNTIIPGEDEVADQDMGSLEKANDLETDDVLTDPALRGQTGFGFLSDVKLPVMKVKTLPVEEDDESSEENKVTSEQQQMHCWWLPAIVLDMFRYIPMCLLFASVVLLTVIMLRLVFLLCRMRVRQQQEAAKNENLIYDESDSTASSCYLPPSDLPPSSKYALYVSEFSEDSVAGAALARQPPPKYDDVIVIDAELAKIVMAAGIPTEKI